VSKIQFDDDEYEKPAPEHLEKALRDLEELVEKQIATIRLKPESEAWIHFNGGSGQSASDIKIHYQDLYLLAEELRDYGADVTVLSPIELVKEVRRGFEQVASDHA
jgi:proteasome accessory factor B